MRVRVSIVATKQEFKVWLDLRIFQRYGVGPSWRQLSRESGISEVTLRRLRRGERLPQASVARKLAVLLNVPPVEVERMAGIKPLWDVDPDAPSPPPLSQSDLSIVRDALIRTLVLLPSDASDQ